LKVHGIREGQIRLAIMSYAEQLSALREGTLDAGFVAVSPYNEQLARFAAGQPIRIVGLDAAHAKTFEQPPFWTPVPVRAGTYPRQDADLLVPGQHTTLLASRQADPALIYQITKTIVENGRELGDLHPGGREFTAAKTKYLI